MASHLLTIPVEVRLKILKELLYRREGIHFRSRGRQKGPKNAPSTSASVQPQILACCRQILQEGKPLFQSNRLHLNMGVCGYASIMETNVLNKLPCGFHKVQITLEFGEDLDILAHGWDLVSDPDYERVYKLVGILRTSGACTDLRIHFRDMIWKNEQSIDSIVALMTQLRTFDDAYELLMSPFRLPRGLEHVDFLGQEFSVYLKKVIKEMTGNSQVIDLPAMYYALLDWGVRNDPSFFKNYHHACGEAEKAAFTMDAEEFYEIREFLAGEFYNIFIEDRNSIFDHDPKPLSGIYKAVDNDIVIAVHTCMDYGRDMNRTGTWTLTRTRIRTL